MQTLNQLLIDHFRCPEPCVDFVCASAGESRTGYFMFGKDIVCYGRNAALRVARTVEEPLQDALAYVRVEPTRCELSFDPFDAVESLRHERYISNGEMNRNGSLANSLTRRIYYSARPLMPISIRKHLQRLYLVGRMKTRFPSWPVDRTADRLLENLLAMSMRAQGRERIPFIWFWPDGYKTAAIMTHDVETLAGVKFCSTLMDLDEEYDVPASFQIIPEGRYPTPKVLLDEIRLRGFEVNVHDLNHDGRLYWERREFVRRVERINKYAREFRAEGFRAGALYRNQGWYDEFKFSYDMSVPNVGHLDPQPGGCCTVFPYFIGRILELPVTTTQDYAMFQFLGDYSSELWIRQINLIRKGHGLITVITHPDYLQKRPERKAYVSLLAHLARLRSEAGVWIALPSQVNNWWRVRNRMKLVQENGAWRIVGPEKERARIAYASLTEDGIELDLTPPVSSGALNSDRVSLCRDRQV